MKEFQADTELQQILNALTAHGRNARRQKQLMAQIDQLAGEKENPSRKLWPWMASAISVAACLLIIVLTGKEPQKPVLSAALHNDTIMTNPQIISSDETAEITMGNDAKYHVPRDIAQLQPKEQMSVPEGQDLHEDPQEPETTSFTPILEKPIEIEPIEEQEIPQTTPVRKVIQTNTMVAYNRNSGNSRRRSRRTDPDANNFMSIPYETNPENILLAINL